jgi:hypothetical protein
MIFFNSYLHKMCYLAAIEIIVCFRVSTLKNSSGKIFSQTCLSWVKHSQRFQNYLFLLSVEGKIIII